MSSGEACQFWMVTWRCYGAVESVAGNELTFSGRFAVRLEDVDGLDRVSVSTLSVADTNEIGCLNAHGGEELGIAANDLAGHAGFGGVDDAFLANLLDTQAQLFLDILDSKSEKANNQTCSVQGS